MKNWAQIEHREIDRLFLLNMWRSEPHISLYVSK